MRFKFLDWYTQAIGATLGIIACIYSYLNGYMFVYTNIGNNFENLGFGGIISSYLLLPLCVLTLILGLIKSYLSNKEILNTTFESINIFVIIFTIIIGFMGAKIYFFIPAILILFNLITPNLHNNKSLEIQEIIVENKTQDIAKQTMEFNKIKKVSSYEANKLHKNNINDINTLKIKQEIAIDLLIKNSSKQFIMELTGFTIDEINTLEKNLGIINI